MVQFGEIVFAKYLSGTVAATRCLMPIVRLRKWFANLLWMPCNLNRKVIHFCDSAITTLNSSYADWVANRRSSVVEYRTVCGLCQHNDCFTQQTSNSSSLNVIWLYQLSHVLCIASCRYAILFLPWHHNYAVLLSLIILMILIIIIIRHNYGVMILLLAIANLTKGWGSMHRRHTAKLKNRSRIL